MLCLFTHEMASARHREISFIVVLELPAINIEQQELDSDSDTENDNGPKTAREQRGNDNTTSGTALLQSSVEIGFGSVSNIYLTLHARDGIFYFFIK